MKFICIIPARYGSTRFPGKPLAPIAGSPMIEWVYKRARRAKLFERIIVATDHAEILDAVHGFGGEAELTPSDLASGTDRVAFMARKIEADVYVNLQGDEPLISPQLLTQVCSPYAETEIVMTTPIRQITSQEELVNPNLVRVVVDNRGNALYFTRSVVPFIRDAEDPRHWVTEHPFYKHIGIYTYRRDFLLYLATLSPGRLEQAEKLEQLRVLENGFKIRTVLTDYDSLCVDTPDDLLRVENFVKLHKMDVNGN